MHSTTLVLAAENATRRCAHRQSIAVLEHARALLPMLAADRAQAFELQILERMGKAYYALGDMERSARTYASMATRAADAGLLAERADALMRMSHPAESIPFFLQAVEIDPDFAPAYLSLSRIYSNLGEIDRAKDYAELAYERRDRVGERDRLSITYQYHYRGDRGSVAGVADAGGMEAGVSVRVAAREQPRGHSQLPGRLRPRRRGRMRGA